MSRHSIIILLVIGTLLITSCSTTDIYLVRHAEKVDESRDPALTAAGMQRARDLKDALIRKGITDITARIICGPGRQANPWRRPLAGT